MPFGGKYQATEAQGMVAKIPVLGGETDTSTIMTYGYNPKIGKWSPYHGALYAVVESVAKLVALGGNYATTRLTFQEYFERLGKSPERWGKPFAALLGAYYAQEQFEIPAIGGKDSMSGTFKDIDVPPTLVSFAVDTVDAKNVVTISAATLDNGVVDFDELKKNLTKVRELILDGKVLSSYALGFAGVGEAVAKMGFGNHIGFKFSEEAVEAYENTDDLFAADYGTILLELAEDEDILEAGIRIISQPPGKKLQNMMQLSGGEKALTAIALLFAIQNLKPSPFCLLDEIEAALDDSNVGRFASYLQKLTKNTQFIIITHRRGSMNAADRLYGITMQEKGVSTLVSVDLVENQLSK